MPSMPSMPTIPTLPSLNTKSAPKAQAPEPTQPVQEENNPFTQDQLDDAWAGLNGIFRDEPRLLAVLAEYTPKLVNEHLCVLTLANPWQQQEFKKFGKQVMDRIRSTLHNSHLQLSLEVAEYDQSQRAYTAEEKYKVLSELNPELANLKSLLDLQLE